MKKKLAVMAGCIVSVIATTAMSVNAKEINAAVSGSAYRLGLGIDLSNPSGPPIQLGTVGHSVNIALKRNGKKSKNPHDRSTSVSNVLLSPTPIGLCTHEEGDGVLFQYVYSYAVETRLNGDLIFAKMVTGDPSRVSTACATLAPPYFYEITGYREITGGTGEYEGACGWTELNVTGNFLDATLSSFGTLDGRQVGEIFHSSDCP